MDTGIASTKKETTRALTSERPDRGRWLYILALVVGLGALVLGPLAGGLFIALSLIGRPVSDAVSVTTIGISIAALGLGLGGALAWVGHRGLRGRPSRPVRPGMKWGISGPIFPERPYSAGLREEAQQRG